MNVHQRCAQFVPDLCGKDFTEKRGRIKLEVEVAAKEASMPENTRKEDGTADQTNLESSKAANHMCRISGEITIKVLEH